MSLPNQTLYTTTPPSRPCQCFALRAEMIRVYFGEDGTLVFEQLKADGSGEWLRVSPTEFSFFSGPITTKSLEQRSPDPPRHVPHDKPDEH